MKKPILFITFQRLDTTKKVFKEIKKYQPEKLFIASDGPRNKDEEIKCNNVRNYILNNIDWKCEIKTRFLEKNLGIKLGPSSAISWFFNNVDDGILLEHDCVPNQDFFFFCENLLEKYKNDKRIMHISGNFFQKNKIKNSYYFSKIPHIWGWATWKRAWNLYDINMNNLDDFLKNKNIEKIFKNKRNYYTWEHLFKEIKNEKIKTWDFQWTYAIFKNNGIAINPNKNLVTNIGFGDLAENCKNKKDKFANMKLETMNFPLNHPAEIEINEKADSFTTRNNFYLPFYKYFLLKIGLLKTAQKIKNKLF